ncbi:MAG: rRNA maturation RNase YbeY [Alphaproteobacteria bacterium]|nr:rRNA maturation RNase YbeY [Alphaproteobacteria bacterium]
MTSKIKMDIDILTQDDRWPDVTALIRKAVETALSSNVNHSAEELSIALSNDVLIQELNKNYRDKDKPTNVLSFPQDDDFSLGDIVLALETIQREAGEQNKHFEDHLSHLVIHGTLHLLGYDHEDDAQAEEMEALEIELLQRIGIENPYLDSDTPIDAM